MQRFLRNSWYCAGWGSDVSDKPHGIKILNQDIVLFRTSDGRIAALNGRCPHRFAPLSIGCVKRDVIECGYHGLQFDRNGTCTLNPHGEGIIPPRAHTNAFQIEERHGALWIWMGQPGTGDPSDILDLYFTGGKPGWEAATGYLKINSDYQLVIDNLLDLTHGTYLHPTTVGVGAEHSTGSAMKYDFKTEGNVVHSNYTFLNSPPTALFRPFYHKERCDIYAFMRWEPAGSLLLDISTSDVGQPKGTGIMMPSCHLIVPETESSCHYFWAIARNVELDDKDKTQAMKEAVAYAFEVEDEPVIEACQRMMNGEEFFNLEPAILSTDVAGIQARRILSKLVARETKAQSAQAND